MNRSDRLLVALLLVILGTAGCAAHAPLNAKAIVHQRSGARLLAQGRLDEAEAQLVLALEYNPGYPQALNGLGLLAYRRGIRRRRCDSFATR